MLRRARRRQSGSGSIEHVLLTCCIAAGSIYALSERTQIAAAAENVACQLAQAVNAETSCAGASAGALREASSASTPLVTYSDFADLSNVGAASTPQAEHVPLSGTEIAKTILTGITDGESPFDRRIEQRIVAAQGTIISDVTGVGTDSEDDGYWRSCDDVAPTWRPLCEAATDARYGRVDPDAYRKFLERSVRTTLKELNGIETAPTSTTWGPAVRITSGPSPLSDWIDELAARGYELALSPSTYVPIDRHGRSVVISPEVLKNAATSRDHRFRRFLMSDTEEVRYERRIEEIEFEAMNLMDGPADPHERDIYTREQSVPLLKALERAGFRGGLSRLHDGRLAIEVTSAPAGDDCAQMEIPERYCALGNLMNRIGRPFVIDPEVNWKAGYHHTTHDVEAVSPKAFVDATRGDTVLHRHEYDHYLNTLRKGDLDYPYNGNERAMKESLDVYSIENAKSGYRLDEIQTHIDDLEQVITALELDQWINWSGDNIEHHFTKARAMTETAHHTTENILRVMQDGLANRTDGKGWIGLDRHYNDDVIGKVLYRWNPFAPPLVKVYSPDGILIRRMRLNISWRRLSKDREPSEVIEYLEMQREEFDRQLLRLGELERRYKALGTSTARQ